MSLPNTQDRPASPGTPWRAALIALRASLLGPALLLGPDPVLWGAFQLAATLDALGLAFAGVRLRPGRAALLWPVLLLALVPLESVLLREACRVTGLADDLPLVPLALLLAVHLGALGVLLGREPGTRPHLRRLGLLTACWLPAALLLLAGLGRLEALAAQALAAAGGASPAAGWLRLPLAALLLAALQRSRRTRRPGEERTGHGQF